VYGFAVEDRTPSAFIERFAPTIIPPSVVVVAFGRMYDPGTAESVPSPAIVRFAPTLIPPSTVELAIGSEYGAATLIVPSEV
jgi:hypothetical protein